MSHASVMRLPPACVCITDAWRGTETICLSKGYAEREGSRAEQKRMALTFYFWCRVALFASAVVMFILLGVGVSKYTKSHLGHKFIPWPHWAWCIAVINSWLWTGLAVVAYRGGSLVQCHCIESN